MKSKAFRIEDYLPGIFNKNEKSNAESMEKNQRNPLPTDVDQVQKVRFMLDFATLRWIFISKLTKLIAN